LEVCVLSAYILSYRFDSDHICFILALSVIAAFMEDFFHVMCSHVQAVNASVHTPLSRVMIYYLPYFSVISEML
jgi:hypothetical protein